MSLKPAAAHTTPRVEGTSLLFDEGQVAFEKLFTLPVYEGPAAGPEGIEINLALNLTMRPCEGIGCLGLGDWDPIFLLSDGSTMFGIQLSNDGEIFIEQFQDAGLTGTRLAHGYFYDRNAPLIGDAVDIGLDFFLGPSATGVRVTYDGAPQTYFGGPALDASAGLKFAFVRDNDFGEQHQLNSITFNRVPEPETYALLLVGLGLIGIMTRRTKQAPPR